MTRTRRRTGVALAALTAAAFGHPGPVRADDADPWFGPDKALHLEATGALAIVGYAGTAMISTDRRAGAGAALAVGVGIGKELWDLDGHGDASWRDLTWDLIGATAGVLIAVAVDWSLHRIFDWPVGRQSR